MWLPGDTFCLRRRTTTNQAIAQGAADAKWSRTFAQANGGTYQQCPVGTQPPRRTQEQIEDDLARHFWDTRVLPDPVLDVAPDYALTGKKVYLQIAGPQQQHFVVDNPLGPDVTIDATSRYVVDWGDHATTTTASQGGPWPDGDVTHVYTDVTAGAVITVTQVWTAHWTAGHNSGDLAGLHTAGTLTVPVKELQAIING